MLGLLFLSAILAIFAQCEKSTTLKYYTVNTYKTRNDFSFSCYGVGAACEVYYSPSGTGCTGTSLTSIGTIQENETQVLTSDVDLELGGGFCSDNQIGVYDLDGNNYVVANLPRATEAGTKFQSVIYPHSTEASYDCTLTALVFPASVTIDSNGDVETIQIGSFGWSSFSFRVDVSVDRFILKVDSNSSVILSCVGSGFPLRLVTFQPISSEPLVIHSDDASSTISWMILNCSTNELITDFSKVSIKYVKYNGETCPVTLDKTALDTQAYSVSDRCAFYFEPLDNVCVSVGKQTKKFYLTSVGLPNPKLSIRFVNYPGVGSINLLSFSETKCVGFSSKDKKEYQIILRWGGVPVYGDFSTANWFQPFSDLNWMDCQDPILVVVLENAERFPFLSACQSEELWQPFFDSLNPAPTEDPSPNPIPSPSPSFGTRSLFPSVNWLAFFGFNLFWFDVY